MIAITEVKLGLYRSAQPMTPSDFSRIRELGITTIIDLENKDEEKPWPISAAGLDIQHFPLSGFWAPKKEIVCPVLIIMAQASLQKPTLIHCLHGHDRTGLLVGLFRCWRMGWTKKAAWKEMNQMGYHPILLGLSYFFWFVA